MAPYRAPCRGPGALGGVQIDLLTLSGANLAGNRPGIRFQPPKKALRILKKPSMGAERCFGGPYPAKFTLFRPVNMRRVVMRYRALRAGPAPVDASWSRARRIRRVYSQEPGLAQGSGTGLACKTVRWHHATSRSRVRRMEGSGKPETVSAICHYMAP